MTIVSDSKLSRREALRALTIATSGLLFSACAGTSRTSDSEVQSFVTGTSQQARVIVIGAGIAGLGAAQFLRQNDVDVIVLEARDRIGGRIWTNRNHFGVPVDYGAAWIHGSIGNPLSELANQQDLTRPETSYEELVIYDFDGATLDEDDLSAAIRLLNGLLRDAAAYGETLDNDQPLQSGIDRALAERDLDEAQLRALDLAIQYQIEGDLAADTNDLSLWWYDSGTLYPGREELISGGYDLLLAPLASNVDVRLNHVVTSIDYSSDMVSIATSEGEYTSDVLLVTLPLGVLKARTVTFAPALPPNKITAIDRMVMGTLDKLTLQFEDVFWDNVEFILYASENAGEWSYIKNLDYFFDVPVLQMFIGAQAAVQMEGRTDREVIESGMAALRAMYGDQTPEPTNSSFSRWNSDPYSYGSYSNLGVGAIPEDFDTLAAPLENRIFFAGEATNRQYYQTAHGALQSGRRAAREILAL